MSTRTKLRDAATLLDDFIEQCELPPENWLVMAEAVTEIDAGDELLAQMQARFNDIFEPLPFFDLKVTFNSHGPFGPMIGRTQIKGKTVKMAIQMAVLGLENNNIEFEQVEPWPTSGS